MASLRISWLSVVLISVSVESDSVDCICSARAALLLFREMKRRRSGATGLAAHSAGRALRDTLHSVIQRLDEWIRPQQNVA